MKINNSQFPPLWEGKEGLVSILGCGWLGFPLAKELVKKGHSVKGSTTTPEKLRVLASEGIEPFLISVSSEGVLGNISSFLKDTEVLIIDFPPGLRKNPEQNYSKAIENLIREIEKSEVRKVIFISSIAVFEEEEDFPEYAEKDLPNGTSYSARQLISAENIFLDHSKIKTTVLRFGGLIGAERHPVKFLSGRQGVKNPEAPVNLIHLVDCIGIIATIIEKDNFSGIYHGVFPSHPAKKIFYAKASENLGLPGPVFEKKEISIGKRIISVRLERELNFSFKIKLNENEKSS